MALTPKERIEALYSKYPDGTGYIRVARDGTDYVATIVGSYKYRGRYLVRRYSENGILIYDGILPGTSGDWQSPSEIAAYASFFSNPFPIDGIDDTPNPSIPSFAPNLTEIETDYSTTDGFGQVSVERALEYLKDIEIPDQAPVKDMFDERTDMYNLDVIGAPEAWSVGLRGSGIIVAVLDTGVDIDHIDLNDNIWNNPGEIAGDGIDNDGNGYVDDVTGWDFVNNDASMEDADGHGTHVAGTIAAENNGIGVIGAAFDAKIMPIKCLPASSETGGGSFLTLAQGIYYAVDNGAHVINMSLGGGYNPPQVVRDAIEYANNNNVICVMAAGNDYAFGTNPDANSPMAPGSYASEFGIVVGATDKNENMTYFSNRAGESVDWDNDGDKELLYVTGSGQQIWSTTPNNTIGSKDGTSMACPLVAAACAILIQADPTLTPDQIRVLLANSTK